MVLQNPPRNGEGDASVLPELVSGRGTAQRSGVVEGQARRCFIDDPAENRIGTFENVSGRNGQCLDPGFAEPIVSCLIALRSMSARMSLAIDFDRQASVAAEEIKHEGTSRMLPPELQSGGTLPQPMPQENFRETHLPAQVSSLAAGACARIGRDILKRRLYPSTMLRMVPLPQTSSGRTWRRQ
jgi:hypothetical protein